MTYHDWFMLWFYLMISFILWIIPAWVILRILTPRKLIQRYFRYPHFTPAELALMDHFPGSLSRTMIFNVLCVNPQWGRKRSMLDIREHSPGWFVTCSKIFVPAAVLHGAFTILLMVVMGVYIYIVPNEARITLRPENW